jgi:excisionase family DNA binding protein
MFFPVVGHGVEREGNRGIEELKYLLLFSIHTGKPAAYAFRIVQIRAGIIQRRVGTTPHWRARIGPTEQPPTPSEFVCRIEQFDRLERFGTSGPTLPHVWRPTRTPAHGGPGRPRPTGGRVVAFNGSRFRAMLLPRKELPLKPTHEETVAMRNIADALLAFLLAHEEARTRRQRDSAPAAPVQRLDPVAMSRERKSEPPPQLLTSREAARYLSICERTLFRLAAPRGPLPTVRIGSAVRFAQTDLDAYIDRMREEESPDT